MSDPCPYAPDFVSAQMLGYLLDCSTDTIDNYVKNGLLPKPERIGNLVRWDFDEVLSSNLPDHELQRIWNEGGARYIFPDANELRRVLGMIREKLATE